MIRKGKIQNDEVIVHGQWCLDKVLYPENRKTISDIMTRHTVEQQNLGRI